MTARNIPKYIYANDKVHNNSQMKAANIYIAPIYMYARFRLGVYSLYICKYTYLEAYAQSRADIYMYIYIHTHLNLGAQG